VNHNQTIFFLSIKHFTARNGDLNKR